MFERWLGNQVQSACLGTFRTLVQFLRCLKLKWKGAPTSPVEKLQCFPTLQKPGIFKLSMLDPIPQEMLISLVWGGHDFCLFWGLGKMIDAQSCLTLCDPMDYTVHGILQARILEWVAFPFSRGSSQPWDRTQVSCIASGFFTSWATKEAGGGQ